MNIFTRTGVDAPEQARPGPDMSGSWLSVPEAVAYCETQGLSRNIKTIRRWAQRSHARPENAEVLVHEQDTGNGFRYVIEKTSLDRKIAQEIAFDAMRAATDRVADTPGQTPHAVEPQVADEEAKTDEDTPAQAQAGADPSVRKLEVISRDEGFLRDQISQKDVQIAELNEQMRRKDDHISAMLERDKETNVLIHRLQDAMSRSLGVSSADAQTHRLREGDSTQSDDRTDRV
jgi:hypothetical protein